MNVFEQIDYAVKKEVKDLSSKKASGKSGGLFWLVTEIFQIIVCVIGALYLLWFYAPYSIYVKGGISFLSLLVVFDVFKSFVWVRWILYKEGLE